MRKAYSYIRMSTNIQLKGDSLRRQLELSQNYALAHSLELVDTVDGVPFKDIGISGFNSQNSQSGALSVFLKCLDEGKIAPNSVLLIESLDRLSRSRISEALSLFMSILTKGIEIVTLTDNQRYTNEIINQNQGALFISLGIMFRANDESETKSKRLKAVWENKRKNADSIKTTRVCPGWLSYNEENKDFEIINNRVEVVRTIFQMCISTCGLYGIARYLNENHIPVFGRGKLWHRSYIKKVISNRAVLGEYQPTTSVDNKKQPNGMPFKNYYPSIIDEDIFLLANAALNKRNLSEKGRKGTFFSNLFTGIIFCGECNSAMTLLNKGIRGGKQFRCTNKNVSGGCKSSDWNLINFEKRIFNHLLEVDFNSLLVERPIETLAFEIDALIAKQMNKQIEADKLLDLSVSGDLITLSKQQIIKKLNVITTEIEALGSELLLKQSLEQENKMHIQLLSKAELKKLILLVEKNSENYLFRSQLNQILRKTISRIELIDDKTTYQVWDVEQNDGAVLKYMAENALTVKDFDKFVEMDSFKRFYKNYNKRILIRYKTGAIRHFLFGADISFNANNNRLNRKIKKD